MAQINKPNLYFNTKLYTGNGSTQSISGIGFQPDWTWIKNRSTAGEGHHLYDAVRGVTKRLRSDTTAAESTASTGLTTFGTDGFTVGSNDGCNKNGVGIVSWNWKAGTGQGSSNTDGSTNTTYTSVNTTAGFSISQYTGTSSAATIGHGLGAVPAMIIVKNLSSGSRKWAVWHKNLSANTKYLSLNSTDAEATDTATWNNTAPTSTVFSSAGSGEVNQNGENFIAYCFAEKKGFSKFGTYTGNGNVDGPMIYSGFKPAWGIFKRTNSTGNWIIMDNKRSPFNEMQKNLFANTNDVEDSSTSYNDFDFVSNGVKIREDNNDINASGSTYIYMLFAENPIVGTNNIPATAR